eukprot:13050907-Alexandrium_andersonii.AAC.1
MAQRGSIGGGGKAPHCPAAAAALPPPPAGARTARSRLVRGAALGHLEDGRSYRLLFHSVVGHDADRHPRGPQS